MATEIVHFLMKKFTEGLQGEDDTAKLFDHRFRELKWELEQRTCCTMPLAMTNLLRELLYDLNDILMECRTLSRRRSDRARGRCVGCFSLRRSWFCYRTKRRLLMIRQRIRAIGNEGAAAMAGGETSCNWKATEFDRWTSPAVDMARIHGLAEEAAGVEELLIEQGGRGFRAVGLVGMGGVGKTTLAQVVFNSPHVRRHFFPRLWVCMSQTTEKGKDSKKETVERMLMSLGVEEVIYSAPDGESGGQSLAALAFALHLQLRGKRYLIVFDDVWNDTDEWYEGLEAGSPRDGEWGDRLAHGLPKGDGGGVIVTGRIEAAVKGMVGEGETRSLSPSYGREACWSIFMDAYTKGGHAVVDPALKSMEAEITDRCCGLPLAARTLGEMMSEINCSSGTSSRGGNSSYASGTSGSLERGPLPD